jgi:SH3-like domain-containing protein
MTVQTMRDALGFVLAAGLAMAAMPSAAQEVASGPVSGLPLPRYVSLKSDRVNLREGPSKEHRTSWVFQRAGLPVEVTAEFETWRRVRDADGTEGWVLHSLLSGRRTVLVSPWSKNKGETFSLRETNSESAPVVATLEPGVIANVQSCQNTWCRITVSKIVGYIKQDRLWGVYPNETVQ